MATRARQVAVGERDDGWLIAEAQRGSLEAFNILVQRHERSVYAVVHRLVGRHAAADEVTQDTFVRAYNALDRFQGDNLRPWLLRIATNRAYDELRRRRRAPISFEELPFEAPVTWSTLAVQSDLEGFADRFTLAQALQEALDELSADQRLAIVLSDVQGYDYREIAALTGSAYGTIKSRLSRARARLRFILSAQPAAAALLPATASTGATIAHLPLETVPSTDPDPQHQPHAVRSDHGADRVDATAA